MRANFNASDVNMDVVTGLESVMQWTQTIRDSCEESGNPGALKDIMELVEAFKDECNSGNSIFNDDCPVNSDQSCCSQSQGHVASSQEQLDSLYMEEKGLSQCELIPTHTHTYVIKALFS